VTPEELVTLWRPTGPQELALVEASGWTVWPPRLPDQPIFYPVLNEDYAIRIARDWNVKASGSGFVTRFQVRKSFLDRYDVQQAGGQTILEYWIPAEDLDELNRNIVGRIEVVRSYPESERGSSGMEISVVLGDITTIAVSAIVTAANSPLIGGGGVDGAVHRAAGPELLRALRPLAPCPVGSAVITPSFRLPSPVLHVIHAVGPRYGVDHPPEDLLASAYLASLVLCDEVGAASVAFPSLSTGAYGYPLLEACEISVRTLKDAETEVQRCVLVAFDAKTQRFWERFLNE
jgi:O-acetyl-ADP-ribose deacetylase (regulator of RNase III)